MKDYNTHTDQEIWNLLQSGDQQALSHVFTKHYGRICSVAYRMIADKQIAEDLGQEVFMDLWNKRKQLMIKTSLGAYLSKAISNKTLNHIRDNKIKLAPDDKILQMPTKGGSVQQSMESEELQLKIKAAIASLPERCRMVFVLSRYQQLTYAEIAENLDISVKTVENQISKALKILKLELKPYVGCLLISIIQYLF